MLGSATLMAFVPTRDFKGARAFYEGVLGLRMLSEDRFALLFDANGIRVRIAHVPEFTPQRFTVLGWNVPNIEETMAGLQQRGVSFERYGWMEQDKLGIWMSPAGAKVAWFKDPDGNVLSLSQHP